MSQQNVQDVLDAAGSVTELLLTNETGSASVWDYLPDEHSNWLDEQRAWHESVALMDQSYHMADVDVRNGRAGVRGSDAIDFFADIGINTFEDFRSGDPPNAKQLVMCNPDGYVIGDCILFYLEEGRFLTVGASAAQNWILYNAEVTDRDVDVELVDHPFMETTPVDYRFELMGPDSLAVMEEVVDGSLPDVGFFEMATAEIDGNEVYLLGHQMSGDRGLELFGAYEHHDAVKEAILEAGEEYGLRQLGSLAYKSVAVEIGWIALPVPAIYEHEDLADYREWLPSDGYEANLAIGGSYRSDDVTDYYMTPDALGYDRLADLDHDFVGREAVRRSVEESERTKVTLVWDDEDVIDVYASLFGDDDPYHFFRMPDTYGEYGDVTRYDEVTKDGAHVGVSKWPTYTVNHQSVLSLASVDREHADPGTEVAVTWSDPAARSRVEKHREREVRATVAPSPYADHGRTGM